MKLNPDRGPAMHWPLSAGPRTSWSPRRVDQPTLATLGGLTTRSRQISPRGTTSVSRGVVHRRHCSDCRVGELCSAMLEPQLVARDLRRSFTIRIAPHRRVARYFTSTSPTVKSGFLCRSIRRRKNHAALHPGRPGAPESGEVEFEGQRLYRGSQAAQAKLRNQKMGLFSKAIFCCRN